MHSKLFSGSVYVGAATLIGLLLEYTYQIFMAHSLSASDFGLLGISLSVLGILTIVLTYGVGISLAKFISEDMELNRVRDYIYNGLLLESVLVFTVALILFILSLLVLPSVGLADLRSPLALVAVILPFFVFSTLAGNLFQGLQRMGDLAGVMVLHGLTKLGASVLLVYLSYGLFGALAGFFVGSFIGIIYFIIRLKDYLKVRKVDMSIIRKLVSFSVYVSLAIIIVSIIQRADSILLKSLYLPNDVIGLYLGPAMISRMAFYPFWAISLVILPFVSSSKTKLNLKSTYVSLLAVLFAGNIVSLLFSKQIVALLLPPFFLTVTFLFPLLVFGMSILGLGAILMAVIMGLGYPKVGAQLSVFALIVYLVSFFTFVPKIGVVGSALSIIFGALALSVSSALMLRKISASKV